MNYLNYFEEKGIEFKGPNKRGFIQLENCPFCDKEWKMNVNIGDEGTFPKGFHQCYSCRSKSGDFRNLRAKIENIDISELKKHDKPNKNKISINLQHELPSQDKVLLNAIKNWRELKLEEFIKPIRAENKEAIEYLNNRGVDLETIELLDVRYVKYDKNNKDTFSLQNRVVFPVTVNKKVYGYIARDITGQSKIKVLNSGGALTSDFIWNFDNIKNSKQIIICEGIFDAITCGTDRACALLGKGLSMHNTKLDLICTIPFEECVIYLDNGAYKDSCLVADLIQLKRPDVNIKIATNPINLELDEKYHSIFLGLLGPKYSSRKIKCIKRSAKVILDHLEGRYALKVGLERVKNDYYFKENANYDLFKRIFKRVYEFRNNIDEIRELSTIDFQDANDLDKEQVNEIINKAHTYIPNLKLAGH